MRYRFGFSAAILLCFTAASAQARDLPHACDLLTEAEAGNLLGTQVQITRGDGSEAVVCAGFCPMQSPNTTSCQFDAEGQSGKTLFLKAVPPPFSVPNWPAHAFRYFRDISRSTHRSEIVENIPWPQGNAVWYFDPANGSGNLMTFSGHRIWFEVSVSGVKDGARALHIARRAAEIVQTRYDAKTKEAP